ncbi:MAG: hypothetical protein ACKVQW_15550 [Pyrinomonadaceae bacterium]
MKNIKNIFKALACMIVMMSMGSAIFGQNFAYSAVDNNQDASARRQQFYRINVSNGETTYLGDLVSSTGVRIQREYEGIASIGSSLYGVAEFAGATGGGVDCNTGDDPIAGLSSDLRVFRVGPVQTVPDPANPTPAQVSGTNGLNTIFGPQIGETCINLADGGTEAGMGYNALDGFFYSISSDDLFPASGIRSRLYRISPSTGLATLIAAVTNPDFLVDGGDEFPYLDGFTVFPNGDAYGTEARFSLDPNPADPDNRDFGGLYRINLVSGDADFIKYLFPTDLNIDTGLASRGTNTLFILNERGIIYQTTTAVATAVSAGTAMRSTGATSGAGGGAAGLRIAGCRGAVVANPEFEPAAASVGGCRDFEGFDIPVPAFN